MKRTTPPEFRICLLRTCLYNILITRSVQKVSSNPDLHEIAQQITRDLSAFTNTQVSVGPIIQQWTPLSILVFCVTIVFTMTEPVRHGIWIKFCFKLGQQSAKTNEWLEVPSGRIPFVMVKLKVWYWCHQEGQKSLQSYSQFGRPSYNRTFENVNYVQAGLNENWQLLTVWEMEGHGFQGQLFKRF